MDKEIIGLGDIKVGKHRFHQYKKPISVYNIEISNRVVCNRVHFGRKRF